MTIYACGYKLSGSYFEFSVENANEVDSINNSNVLMILNNSADNKLLNYYTAVRSLIRNNNNLVIVNDTNNKSKIRKAICMLAVSLGCYNIYDCTMHELDSDYVRTLMARKASQLEIEEYIGADIAAYEKVSDLAIQMQTYAKNNDSEAIATLMAENKDVIANIPVVMDFLKSVYDTHIAGTDAKVEKIQKLLDETARDLNATKEKAKEHIIKVKAQEEELTKLRISAESIKKDLAAANKKSSDLERQLNELNDSEFDDGYSPLRYTAFDTSQIKAFNKYIIYFKEIRETMYTGSMLRSLRRYIELAEKKIKLIIYDRQHDFMAAYRDVTIVNGERLSKNPDILKNSKSVIIVTDTNMAVLKAILQMDVDVLIMWDRLKNKEDLVEGSLVTKFYLFGDRQTVRDIENASGKTYQKDRIFVDHTSSDTLYIPVIPDYTRLTSVSQVTNYSSAPIFVGDTKIFLFEFITDQCGINL